jgi:hypothetical protein
VSKERQRLDREIATTLQEPRNRITPQVRSAFIAEYGITADTPDHILDLVIEYGLRRYEYYWPRLEGEIDSLPKQDRDTFSALLARVEYLQLGQDKDFWGDARMDID